MSEVKVNKISPRSGTNVTLGDSGDTITVPSGATFDASNATTTLPSTVVTTTGTQTLTNKTIGSSQLTAPTRHSIRPSLNLDFANSKALDPRITFTRASNATYYDGYTSVKAEENLFINSQALNSWGSGRLDKFADDTTAPDGTTTADRLQQQSGETVQGFILQQQTVVSGLSYTQSGYFKAGTNRNFVAFYELLVDGTSNYTWFNLSTGAVGTTDANHTATITDAGNGWYRCSITYTPNANRTGNTAFYISETDGLATVTDNQGFIYGWGLQFEQRDSLTAYTPTTSSPITKYQPALQTAGNNVARFDHNPTTGESLGLLIEESRTNVADYSEQLDNAYWGKSNSSIEANAIIAPDGTLTADKLIADAANNSHFFGDTRGAWTNNIYYTTSIYAKAGEYSQIQMIRASIFDLSNGTVVSTGGSNASYDNISASIEDVGNGWYRCKESFRRIGATVSNGDRRVYIHDGSSTTFTGNNFKGLYLWGFQVEEGSFPTSYIKTTGSQVTRSADDCEMLNIDQDDWLKQGVGTLYGEFSKPYTGQDNGSNRYPRVFGLTNDQFDANEIAIYFTHATTPNIASFIDKDDTNYHSSYLTSAPLANTYYKASIAYERNNVDSSANGSSTTTDTSVEIPFINRLRIFKRIGGQSLFNFGYIKKLSYYPIKLTKNEVIDLTEE